MSTRLKYKKGDKVMVINGRDKGKTGEILSVLMDKDDRSDSSSFRSGIE